MPTTTRRRATDVANLIGGFVAAEGHFQARPVEGRFAFTVALGAADREMVDLLHGFLGCGRTRWYARRRPHYVDEVCFVVRGLSDLVEVIVPFMDEHLPRSYKRDQYGVWRAALLDYWEHDARCRRATGGR